jgi:hypothetical protein
MAQPKGGAQDITLEQARHSEGIFLTKPEIRPRGESNPSLNHYARGPFASSPHNAKGSNTIAYFVGQG